jgi:ATP-dependent exoDNAse (exonuclease V) alpha subunit
MESTTVEAGSQGLDRAGLSEEQRDVVSTLARGSYRADTRCQTLGGYAGTGKTTCIRALKDKLPGFAVCAFTGKAANVLRRKGIYSATTIHSLIYIPVVDVEGKTRFVLRDEAPKNDGDMIDGFIVDEASMVSQRIYDDLMSFGLPCIFVGDHGQLEPVNCNFNLMAEPDYTLEKIHRNSGEIPRFAEWLRLGRKAQDFRPTSNAVVLAQKGEVEDETTVSADQIICAFNKTRVQINKYVRRLIGHKDLIEIGERVMCLRNDHGRGLFNGMQGTVSKVERVEEELQIDFDSYGDTWSAVPIDPDQFGKEKPPGIDDWCDGNPFDYAYCITCHKAQGDEWPTVLVLEQKCKFWDHRRWAYTAASRAQERLFWVIENRGSR